MKTEDWSWVPEDVLLEKIRKLLGVPIEKQLTFSIENEEYPFLLYLLLILVVSREQRQSSEFTKDCCFKVYVIALNYLRVGSNEDIDADLQSMAWFLCSGSAMRNPQGIA